MTDICDELHRLFNARPIHTFPFDKSAIPRNGIYVLFEKGEEAHGGRRIVHIGTHTSENQLSGRLRQHFPLENKDASIFRKNIGRAILKRREDPFLEHWNLNLSSRKNRQQFRHIVDLDYQQEVEEEVSAYIQQNVPFTVFQVSSREERLHFKSRLISSVSRCGKCGASPGWLGSYSPEAKIRESGLWQVQELWKVGFGEEELRQLRALLQEI